MQMFFKHAEKKKLSKKVTMVKLIRYSFQVLNQNCDRTFQRPEFEIRSVNFPLPYPNGLNCRYLIKRASDDICWVKLVFIRFDLEPSDDCHFDYLSVNGKRICGTLPEDEIRK